ncbi:MAG: cytochrome c oxidase accessory protein CcoG [Azonexus sp.]
MSKPVSKVRAAKLELYRKKGKIHAKAVKGHFDTMRWSMVWFTQIIFYGLCWLNWESDGTVRQAVLFDIPRQKLFLFDLVLWPQDALVLAFVLIVAATALFLVTALAGRLFCGFACPQTVYTSIFTWIETRVEGDHLARLKLDNSPLHPRKLLLKTGKHGIWGIVAVWTAITFVGYFTPIRELLPALAHLQIGPWETFWLIFYAAFTYVQAGLAREAVCQHMCPYSRFQGVMFDPATRNAAYDQRRGEPRSRQLQSGQSGDCIDCGICVQVCPTGIDIRDGLQYQCINCGLCIDACDQVMDRIGAPRGLIRFASEHELSSTPEKQPRWYMRPRVAAYASLLAIFCGLGIWTVSERPLLRVDILRDRGALLRETADGQIENAYTLKLVNLAERPREFIIRAEGIPGIRIVGSARFAAAAGSVRPVSVTVAAPADSGLSGIQPIHFHAAAVDDPTVRALEKSRFALP